MENDTQQKYGSVWAKTLSVGSQRVKVTYTKIGDTIHISDSWAITR